MYINIKHKDIEKVLSLLGEHDIVYEETTPYREDVKDELDNYLNNLATDEEIEFAKTSMDEVIKTVIEETSDIYTHLSGVVEDVMKRKLEERKSL